MGFLIRVLSTDSFWPIALIWLAGSVSVCTVHYHFSLNFVVFLIGPAPPLHSTCMTGSRCISSTLELCSCRWTSRLSIYTKGIDFYLGACHKTLFSLLMILLWNGVVVQLEDIYGSLILVQCDIKLVREKHRLGQKQGMWIKFGSGVLLFLILIAVIWAPMLASLSHPS